MLGLSKIFKRKPHSNKPDKQHLSYTQEEVYKAVQGLETPVNGRQIASKLGWDSACVTNRLSELRRQKRLRIAYKLKGIDGKWRQYYEVAK